MQTLACLVLLCAAAPPTPEAQPKARLRLGTPLPVAKASGLCASLLVSSDRTRWTFHHVSDAVEVFDFATGRRLFRFHDKDKTYRPLAFSHDGKTLAVNGHFQGELELLRLADDARPRRRLCRQEHEIKAAAFLPGDKQIATFAEGRLCIWDVATGKKVREETLKSSRAWFSPDGRSFAARAGEALVSIDVATGRRRRFALPDTENRVAHLSWSADGRLLAAAVAMQVIVYDTKSARVLWRVASAKETPRLAFSPDARSLAVEVDRGVHVHDAHTGRVGRRVTLGISKNDDLHDMAYADSDRLFVLDGAGVLRSWSLRTGETTDADVGHRACVEAVAFTPDGKMLVSVDRNGHVIRWDARNGKRIDSMTVPEKSRAGGSCELSLSADGGAALLNWHGHEDGAETFLDLRQRRAVWFRSPPGAKVIGVLGSGVILPDGKAAALEVRPGDLATKIEIRRADGETRATFTIEHAVPRMVRSLAVFAPESQELLLPVWLTDRRVAVRAIDVATGRVRQSLLGGRFARLFPVLSISPDGRLVALHSSGCIYVWECASGQAIDRIAVSHDFEPSHLVVTNAGRVLLSTYVTWDVRRNDWAFSPNFEHPGATALSPDGRLLAVGRKDSTISLYDVPAPPVAKPPRLDEGGRRRLWHDLSADAATAWRARHRLAASPAEALVLLRERLKPTPLTTLKAVDDLDADDFDTREAAVAALAAALAKGDRAAWSALRRVIDKPPSLEAALRARRLLAQATSMPFAPDDLRLIRAVGLLEQIASVEAKALLKRLASGGPSLLTDEARSALARLRVS